MKQNVIFLNLIFIIFLFLLASNSSLNTTANKVNNSITSVNTTSTIITTTPTSSISPTSSITTTVNVTANSSITNNKTIVINNSSKNIFITNSSNNKTTSNSSELNTSLNSNSTLISNPTKNNLTTAFTETGLPSNTIWFVSYDNISQKIGVPNSIVFSTYSGNFIFRVENVSVMNTTYTTNQSYGYLKSGDSIVIHFLTTPNPKKQVNSTNTATISNSNNFYTSTSSISQTSLISQSSASQSSSKYAIKTITNPQKSTLVNTTGDIGANLTFSGSVFKNLLINFKSQSVSGFKISLINKSSQPTGIPILSNAYMYFIINQSLSSSTSSIDPYVANVVYNFSVPISIIKGKSLSNGNIKLYKYEGSSWVQLNTTFIRSNSTAYFYSATSNSLSTYAVGFQSGSTSGSPTSSTSLSLTLPTGYPTYFWAGAYMIPYGSSSSTSSVTWTIDSNMTLSSTGGSPHKQYINQSYVGHSTSNIGTISTSSGSTSYATIAGIGVNVILANGLSYRSNASSTTDSLSFTPSTANSFVILAYASGGSTISSVSAPTGCSLQKTISDSYSTSEIYTCNSLPATSQTTSVSTSSTSSISIAAYVFPPYSVTLDDSTSTGTITTNGNTYSSGSTINVIGTSTITANPPTGYTFNNWKVSNSANLILSNANSNPTSLTVMGSGTLTANYTSTVTQSCTISISPNTINYGSINPNVNIPTTYGVADTNSGTSSAYVLLYGGNWLNSPNSFGVSNTTWSSSNNIPYSSANKLSSSVANTLLSVSSQGSKTIYFGLNIPGAISSGNYKQTITIENSC